MIAPGVRRRSAIVPGAAAIQTGVSVLKIAAGALAGATAVLAIVNHQGNREVAPAIEPARNETVVYRQAPAKAEARPMRAMASVVEPDRMAPEYNPRAVQTVLFVNPNPGETTFTLVAVTSEPPMTKVGGFIAFPGKEAVADPAATVVHPTFARPGVGRKRAVTTIAEVDDYLWEVYQRAPIKRDRSGDFTWKDPAAANRVGLSLREYVISGMDPDFREQLYHAGRAMDADGIQWAMLSAFRDDYRQKIASGFKASGGNSLHGGSRRTGGYGNGRAADVTNSEGDHWAVWKWLDAHGAKYGLYRPMPGNDPAHIQSKGDWRKLAHSLRETRAKEAVAARETGKEKTVTKVVAVDDGKR
jgi:hypothetical protein